MICNAQKYAFNYASVRKPKAARFAAMAVIIVVVDGNFLIYFLKFIVVLSFVLCCFAFISDSSRDPTRWFEMQTEMFIGRITRNTCPIIHT